MIPLRDIDSAMFAANSHDLLVRLGHFCFELSLNLLLIRHLINLSIKIGGQYFLLLSDFL